MDRMPALPDLGAAEVAAQYARGDLSPVDVVRACLERIAAWEPRLNAMYRIDREGALAAARASEARWRAKAPLSPLDGGRIVVGLLPWRQAYQFSRIEPYGFFIVMALAITGVVNHLWLDPVMNTTFGLIELILKSLTKRPRSP